VSSTVKDLRFSQAFKERTPNPGYNLLAAIKTEDTENIPKYVDLVKPQTKTRSLSISGRRAHSSHIELIKTYRFDEYPVSRTEFCSSRYYPSWPFTTPYRQHSAFSNGRINRRNTIKK